PLRMIGTHTDITETIKIQEKLNTIAERFAYAAKATGQALWEWNAVTGEAYISPSFTELFGWVADNDHHFDQWHLYIHPEDKEQTIESYYETLKQPQASIWQAEYRFLKANNTYATVCDRAYIIRDESGKAIKVIGATQDISAQKKTEEELYKSNERFDIMMMATNELLWDWDIKADQIYRSSGGVKKLYGLVNDNSIKKIEGWLERVHPEDRHKLQQIFGQLEEAAHHQTFEVEYRFLKGNGEYSFIYNRGILLKDDDGKPLRLIGAARDISQRKHLEAELLANELEHKKLINQATVDSQEQERGEIGKELHDNINQVLTTTKLYLELALVREEMTNELIIKSSKNISSVITEIRQLSRSLMDPSLGDLGIIDSVNDLIQDINLTRKVHVSLEIDTQIENRLDKKQKLTLFRIIQESLNNAIRHAKAKFVSVNVSLQQEIVHLVVSDDGIGFNLETAKKGAGLKNITNRVYLVNGKFSIDTEPGKGCKISISFPINDLQ
ncbi:MAG: PAS domain-containing protein, partial [Bacteroidota bacterium]|nr:PAS domain-containing protein [Bacteroidota bacterium]